MRFVFVLILILLCAGCCGTGRKPAAQPPGVQYGKP